MPEIAEVETVKKTLRKIVLNKRIKEVIINYDNIIIGNKMEFINTLINKEILDINRIGKWLIFNLGKYSFLSHLRMEGKYFYKYSNEDINKHEHVIFRFNDGTDLRYHDTRKFGKMKLILTKDIYNCEEIKKLGIEPNNERLTSEYLYKKINKKNIAIKKILLDQSIISGLGNIYANEVLFASNIKPDRLANNISKVECNNIILATNKVIKKAIKKGGTTIRSYTASGVSGRFQNELMVHKQIKCKLCNNMIKCIKIGGRSTYYCPSCQK